MLLSLKSAGIACNWNSVVRRNWNWSLWLNVSLERLSSVQMSSSLAHSLLCPCDCHIIGQVLCRFLLRYVHSELLVSMSSWWSGGSALHVCVQHNQKYRVKSCQTKCYVCAKDVVLHVQTAVPCISRHCFCLNRREFLPNFSWKAGGSPCNCSWR